MAKCPICGELTSELNINNHLDAGCPTSKAKKRDQWSFLSDKPGAEAQESGASPDRRNTRSPKEHTNPSKGHTYREAKDSHSAINSQPREDSLTQSQPTKKAKKAGDDLAPLAEQMRPSALDEYVGQEHLMGTNGILRRLIEGGQTRIPSMVLWGPSGVGKTTLARVLATQVNAKFVELSAPSAGANDVKRVITDAKKDWQLLRRRTILFLDEIHRFSRSQQDSLLAGVEKGDIVLIGATTENPSFKLSSALLSRLRVFVLQRLTKPELKSVVERALEKYDDRDTMPPEIVELVSDAASSTGDARQALNMLETVRSLPKGADPKLLLRHSLVYDQRGDFHYDLISAFHKSVRGSDADAALYYLARMLKGGEDPLYVSRRLMRIASEDIGLADDTCLPFAVAVHTSVQQVGMPECDVMLAHAAVKFARARKSVEVYKALGSVMSEVDSSPDVGGAAVPLHLRNAPTKLMADVGYGQEYKYNPNYTGPVRQDYLPKELKGSRWLGKFQPSLKDEA